MKAFTERIPALNSWLLAAVFFLSPLSVAPAYVVTVLILALCLAEGRFGQKAKLLRDEPLVWIFAAYFLVFVVSLLWTDDQAWGMRMVRRQAFFLLFALYFLVAQREHLPRYLLAYTLSIAMCEVLSYYNFVQMYVWPQLPEGIRVDKGVYDPSPFVDHIMYSPALALAGYLAGHGLLFGKSRAIRSISAVFLLTTAGNLIFSGGRSGILGFLALIFLLALQRFARRPLLAIAGAAVVLSLFFTIAYQSNEYFRERIDGGISEVRNFESEPNTSLGQRLTFITNGLRIYSSSPILGVGVGDYPKEYEKVSRIHSPNVDLAWNPHNQYLYALTSAGLPAFALLLLVLLYPLFRVGKADGREHMRKALPVLLLAICLVESYLLRSNISLIYVLFTAALWCGTKRAKA